MKTINDIAEAAVKKYQTTNGLSLVEGTLGHGVAEGIAQVAARIAIDEMSADIKAARRQGIGTPYAVGGVVGSGESGFSVKVRNGYAGLHRVLVEALDQAQGGKGAERHNLGGDIPFERQRMQQISELIGSVDGMTYQACKKITEGVKLPTLERQVAELLGAINYIAGMIIFLRKQAPKTITVKVAVDPSAAREEIERIVEDRLANKRLRTIAPTQDDLKRDPLECAATGRGHSDGKHGPNGETQCAYCGEAPMPTSDHVVETDASKWSRPRVFGKQPFHSLADPGNLVDVDYLDDAGDRGILSENVDWTRVTRWRPHAGVPGVPGMEDDDPDAKPAYPQPPHAGVPGMDQ